MTTLAASHPQPREAAALQPVDDPAAWTGTELGADPSWIYHLSAAELADLERLVHAIETPDLDLLRVDRSQAALPILGPRIAAIRRQLLHGRGIALIRGLPVDHGFTRRQAAIAYWCIGLHLGDPVSQNAKGHMLGHVKDFGIKIANPETRGNYSREGLPFHTDRCDIVGLLCLQIAKAGGKSAVASSLGIYNEMVRRRPDLAAELMLPIYRDRRGEVPAGMPPYYKLPVFSFTDGLLTGNIQGTYIQSVLRFPEVPRHSEALKAAIALFNELANELAIKSAFEPGDMQFLHSHTTVHSRTEYEDWPEVERKRHLLRLWLATPDGRPLPDSFRDRYPDLKPGERPAGGIVVPGTVLKAPLEAE